MLIRERAFVLKTIPYQEGNLIVTLLTEKNGIRRAIAQKAQTSNHPLHAVCQPLVEADFLLNISGGGLASMLQSEVKNFHSEVRFDLVKSAVAAIFAEWLIQAGGEEGLTFPSQSFACFRSGVYWLAESRENLIVACLRFLVCTISEAGIALDPDEFGRWSLSKAATSLLEEVLIGDVWKELNGYSQDAALELVNKLSAWIYDQTGIVLKSLKIALQLSIDTTSSYQLDEKRGEER